MILYSLLPPTKDVCEGHVLHLSVSHSVHRGMGGSASVHAGIPPTRLGPDPPPPPGPGTHRAVCILLECNLVGINLLVISHRFPYQLSGTYRGTRDRKLNNAGQ